MLRLLRLRLERRRLGAIGLDHHQAVALQQFLWIDPRRLCALEAGRLRAGLLLHALRLGLGPVFLYRKVLFGPRRGCRRWLRGLRVMLFAAQAQRFLPLLFAHLVLARLEALRRAARAGLARTLVAALAMAIAPAATPPAAVLFALALGRARAVLHLRRLRQLRITRLLRIARLLRLPLVLLLRRPRRALLLGTAFAARALAGLAFASVALASVALAARLPVAALLEPALLLPIALPVTPVALAIAASIALAVAASIAALLLMLAPRVALALPLLVRLRLWARCGRGRGLLGFAALEQAE